MPPFELFDRAAHEAKVRAGRTAAAIQVHSLRFSRDGAVCVAGGAAGTLNVFDVCAALGDDEGKPPLLPPAATVEAHGGCVYSMTDTGDLLITCVATLSPSASPP